MEAVMKKHLQMFNFESETDLEKFKECIQYVKQLHLQYYNKLQPVTSPHVTRNIESLSILCAKLILSSSGNIIVYVRVTVYSGRKK